jgi:hypothetical protein
VAAAAALADPKSSALTCMPRRRGEHFVGGQPRLVHEMVGLLTRALQEGEERGETTRPIYNSR